MPDLPPLASAQRADSARLVHTFWALACALDIDVWFEYVRSAANIADWPSRGDTAFAAELGAAAVAVALPPLDTWGVVEPVLGLVEAGRAAPSRKRQRKK